MSLTRRSDYPVLAVRRRFEPLDLRIDRWQCRDYVVTVWSFDGHAPPRVHSQASGMPTHVPGLMTCYINDEQVDLGAFETALQVIGLTLHDVSTAILWSDPDR